jgi:hypothetical protein
MAELGGSQISALLESVPGIAKVLRSPVADALVSMIRAGAGLGDFRMSDVEELVQYSVRRGLISADEGERLTQEVHATGRGRSRGSKSGRGKPAKKPAAKKPAVRTPFAKKAAAAAKQPAATKPAAKKPVAKKPAAKKAAAKKKPAAKKPAGKKSAAKKPAAKKRTPAKRR